MLQKKHIFCITVIVSVIIHLVFFALFSGTMFNSYHMVSGLDMQTLLRFSEWGKNTEVPPFFTLHRLVIYLIWKANSGVHSVNILFLIQSIFGIAGAMATADLILMLTGKRKAALAGGVLYALYLPFLIYEFSVLQETFNVNILLFALWSLFYIRKKRFAVLPSIISGLLFGLTLTGRPVALPLTLAALISAGIWSYRKKVFARWWILLAPVVLVMAGATIFNRMNNSGNTPFYNVLPYTVYYNTGITTATADIKSNCSGIVKTAVNMISRTPAMFSVLEMPENQNLYFWRYKLPEAKLLVGPEILLTLTVFSIMLLLLSGKWKNKEGIVLFIILLLAPALCGREPIGRYRLMLCPYFIIAAVSGFPVIFRIKKGLKRNIILAVSLALAAATTTYELRQKHGLRTSDFHSWALATEAALGNTDTTLAAFFEYWQRSSMSSDSAFRAMMGAAMRASRFDIAATIIRQAELVGKVNNSLIAYYTGVLFVGKQDPYNVKRAFSQIKPEELPPDLYKHYKMILQDTERFIQQHPEPRLNKTP